MKDQSNRTVFLVTASHQESGNEYKEKFLRVTKKDVSKLDEEETMFLIAKEMGYLEEEYDFEDFGFYDSDRFISFELQKVDPAHEAILRMYL
jgi:hypothetical protein